MTNTEIMDRLARIEQRLAQLERQGDMLRPIGPAPGKPPSPEFTEAAEFVDGLRWAREQDRKAHG